MTSRVDNKRTLLTSDVLKGCFKFPYTLVSVRLMVFRLSRLLKCDIKSVWL
jgi:hypothetical protein